MGCTGQFWRQIEARQRAFPEPTPQSAGARCPIRDLRERRTKLRGQCSSVFGDASERRPWPKLPVATVGKGPAVFRAAPGEAALFDERWPQRWICFRASWSRLRAGGLSRVVFGFGELCAPFLNAFFDFVFGSLIARLIIFSGGAEVILGNKVFRKIMRIFVALSMSKAFCALVVGVPQMLRDGQRASRFYIFDGAINGHDGAVAFGRSRNVDDGFGQRYARLGPANEFGCLKSSAGQHKGHRVSQTDILGGMNDDSARNEPRVLASVDHFRQPV